MNLLRRRESTRMQVALVLICLGSAILAPAGRAAPPTEDDATEAASGGAGVIVVEGGWTIPYGDLDDDFNETPYGFGAGDGLELGFRWRFPVSPRLSLAPSFHFVNHRDLLGSNSVAKSYRIESSTLRYGLELVLGGRSVQRGPQPVLAAGVCLNRNRFVGFNKDFSLSRDEPFSALGVSLRAGVLWAGLEWSVVYNVNRFASWRLFTEDEERDHDWSTLTVRLGWEVPLP